MSSLLFREVQYFHQPGLWIFLTLVGIVLIGTSIAYYQRWRRLRASRPELTRLLPILTLAGATLSFLLVVGLLGVANLTTEVRANRLLVKLFPLHLSFHEISLDGVEAVEVTTYRPFADYGGWGIRISSRGTAYNVHGDRGVLITYAGGNPPSILIGSQHPEKLAAALQHLLPRP